MGLFDFVKDAGAKLFGGGESEPAVAQRDLEDVLADKSKSQALDKLVRGMGLGVEDLSIRFRDGRATVSGKTVSQAEREKIVLMIGNTQGVAQVDDRLTVAAGAAVAPATPAEPVATMYTVKSGDSLSKIAKAHYGNAMKYMTIFEANKPMLKDPDKIYPGQVLRIPPLEE
jgi:nucleoid-associated protein YgaU